MFLPTLLKVELNVLATANYYYIVTKSVFLKQVLVTTANISTNSVQACWNSLVKFFTKSILTSIKHVQH